MAYRRTGRISVRRTRRAYTRRRTVYRKPTYRFRRTRYRGRGKFRHTQNCVKFHAKTYLSDFMFPVYPGVTGTGSLQTKMIDLNLQRFMVGNYQLVENMKNYQYMKFNYLAIHVKELNWCGATITQKGQGDELRTTGTSAMNFNNLPVYCYWDVEQDMTFIKDAPTEITDTQFSQYPGVRKMYPGRKPCKFVWRFPTLWRQFYSTYYINPVIFYQTLDIGQTMAAVSGIKQMRYPKHLMISHSDFWKGSLPVNTSTGNSTFFAQFAIEFHIGVTFRGRKLVGNPSIPPKPEPSTIPKEEEESNVDE